MNRLVITTAAAAAALLLTSCGPSQPQEPRSPDAPTLSPSSSSAAPSTSQAPSTAEAPSSSDSSPTPVDPALCTAATLTPTTNATGGGAAGSVYLQLILTNSGTASCALKGFPGVSLTADANGAPIGAAAKRDESLAPVELLLAPGQAGTAVLRYTHAGIYQDCTRVSAAGYRIYPPEDTASLFLAQPTEACSDPGIELLTIGAFQAS